MTSPQPPLSAWTGIAPVHILERVRRLNRAYLNPVVGRIAGRLPGPLVLLRHRGRASGRMYVTPLIAQRTGVGFVIPLTYGDRTDWAKNVLAAGKAEIRQGKQVFAVSKPAIVDEKAVLPMLPPPLRLAVQLVGMKRFMTLLDDHSADA
jgi:deazaflavin-dependent oxidoreductase (nitroreductase family)